MFVKVSDQADPQTVFIVKAHSGVGTLSLFAPTECRPHFSIGEAMTIADDKVITDAQPGDAVGIATLPMDGIDAFNTPGLRGGMMEDDVLPGSKLPGDFGKLDVGGIRRRHGTAADRFAGVSRGGPQGTPHQTCSPWK